MPLDVVCPKCHRIFSREVEEKKIVDEEVIEAPESPPFVMGGPLMNAPEIAPKPTVPKDVATYEYRYRCKHCGYEWSDLKEEERSFEGPR
jgi:rubredoxin